jgi:F-type H+-transporting ATPase subunit b
MHTAFIVASEEPNPLVPAPYDIIWGSISFFILLVLFWKFVLPTFNRMIDERAEKIEGGIEQAKVMQAEAARTRDAYTAQLEAANKEAASIRTGAQSEGEQIIAAAKAEAAVQAAAVTARADAQIQAERDAAVGSLQRDVGALALELASRIVGESLTDDQRARATVDRFIAELEATPAPGATTP